MAEVEFSPRNFFILRATGKPWQFECTPEMNGKALEFLSSGPFFSFYNKFEQKENLRGSNSNCKPLAFENMTNFGKNGN